MKGIILAAGVGTRLYPLTKSVCKPLQSIYDKPMIYYPLSILMQANIKDILIITNPQNLELFQRQLKDGKDYGISISYEIQKEPKGSAESLLIGSDFIGEDACTVIYGDNIFYGENFRDILNSAIINAEKGFATNVGIWVENPNRYGILELDEKKNVLSVEEKPEQPKSNIAITGLYFFPKNVVEKAKRVTPSKRGELEMTTVVEFYLQEGKLKAESLNQDFAWFDAGTFDSKLEAEVFIQKTQEKTGKIIGCLEAIAYENHWIDKNILEKHAKTMEKNAYGKYLEQIGKDRV